MKVGFRALVIDDDDVSRRTAVRILERLGATAVAEAADGETAIAWADGRGNGVDLVLCDLKMPQLDGIETLDGLASRARSAMFVLTSGAEPRLLRAAADSAARCGIESLRVVSKPVTLAKMEAIVVAMADRRPRSHGPSSHLLADPVAVTAPVDADDMRRGFGRGEFIPLYQPKLDIRTKRVQGAEALVRWQNPAHGLLAPASFIGVAHAHGLLADLFFAILPQVVAQCAAWRRDGHELGVSINLPVPVLTSRDLPRRLEEFVAGHGLVAHDITFEVTEDGWLREQHLAREVLTRLRVRGFGLAIDDFGTRYASIQQLLDAPFNEMKIDQGFVRMAADDTEAAIALASSVALARQLDLIVVAEGVETQAQWDLVAEAGCDQAQGYLVARPMPEAEFRRWLGDGALRPQPAQAL